MEVILILLTKDLREKMNQDKQEETKMQIHVNLNDETIAHK